MHPGGRRTSSPSQCAGLVPRKEIRSCNSRPSARRTHVTASRNASCLVGRTWPETARTPPRSAAAHSSSETYVGGMTTHVLLKDAEKEGRKQKLRSSPASLAPTQPDGGTDLTVPLGYRLTEQGLIWSDPAGDQICHRCLLRPHSMWSPRPAIATARRGVCSCIGRITTAGITSMHCRAPALPVMEQKPVACCWMADCSLLPAERPEIY